ncbi:MAG TPA: SAM-dependent methyltransferase [Alphaproteobacteria bacterium]|nr:SAM-dependent methyltransferase [Alphaproteobacteria bacterium]
MARPAAMLSVAVVSVAMLAYEVLLMRLFSIVQWHHFAYMIISIALLGLGASGTFLTLTRDRLLPRFPVAFAASATFFGITAVGSFAFAERLPFNPLEIVWDRDQLLWLGSSYALLILPFLFGGSCIGLAFARFPNEIGRIYACDLIGAGVGALGIVGALFWISPTTALRLVAALGLAGGALALLSDASSGGRKRVAALALAAAAIGTAVWLPESWTALHAHMSQYKGLKVALQVPKAAVIEERSSPLGLLSVVDSPTIPFRHAPGLSLNNLVEPPPQLAIFTDGDNITTMTRYEGDHGSIRYLDFTTAALPYHLLQNPKVLILGAGGGEQVLLALYHSAIEIDAVELNPQLLDLVEGEYAEFAGGIYGRAEVETHLAEARSFVAGTNEPFDLVQIPLLDSFGTAAAGVQSLHESYTYTVEALQDYLGVLRPGGLLAITRWLKLPPRDSLKLFATAVEALVREGASEPGRQLALIRSWNTTTLLVKNGRAFAPGEIDALREFADRRSFDVAYHPDIRPAEANRYNILERPYLYEGATALAGPNREKYIARYKFAIRPATDDRPYFFDFFKWRALPEFLTLRSQGGAAMLDWGYLILFTTLVQAAVLSFVLILAPLWLRQRQLGREAPRARYALYFLALGLGFLFVEIAFIQRFILFLGHPLYAVAVVLAGFLVFAGLGSSVAPILARFATREIGCRGSRLRALQLAAAFIGTIAVLYLFLLPPLFERLMPLPDPAKIMLTLALIAPLAFFMGMPFPLGLAHVASRSEDLLPWAWGINGCASVLSALLATLLAIHIGFTAVVTIAVGLYLAAPMALREPVRTKAMIPSLNGGQSIDRR